MTHQGEVPSVSFSPVTRETVTAGFCCGEKPVNDFFRKDAIKLHMRSSHRVMCATLQGNNAIAGYYALASVTEQVKKLPGQYARFNNSGEFPCLQLAWMGVHKNLQKQKIGLSMLGKVITTFASVGDMIGLPHLIVVPLNDDVKAFYKKMDFEEYDSGTRMFLPLQIAKDAVNAA